MQRSMSRLHIMLSDGGSILRRIRRDQEDERVVGLMCPQMFAAALDCYSITENKHWQLMIFVMRSTVWVSHITRFFQ